MRTHELASILRGISDVLNHLPDTEVTSLSEVLKDTSISQETPAPPKAQEQKQPSAKTHATIEEIYQTLTTLPKRKIVELIDEADISVQIRGKDSAKDTARKVRSYLTAQPNSTRKVNSILIRKHSAVVSEPLSKALGILLGDRDEVPSTRS